MQPWVDFTSVDFFRVPAPKKAKGVLLAREIIYEVWSTSISWRKEYGQTAILFQMSYYSKAPHGFFYFLNVKKSLDGQKFELKDDVIGASEANFENPQRRRAG